MKTQFTVEVESSLAQAFEMALAMSGESKEYVIGRFLRNYIVGQMKSVIEMEERPYLEPYALKNRTLQDYPGGTLRYHNKANRKIPKWAKNPHMVPYKIIRAFCELENDGIAYYEELEKHCSDPVLRPEVYVENFQSNFMQMRIDTAKSYGKVFELLPGKIVELTQEASILVGLDKHLFLGTVQADPETK